MEQFNELIDISYINPLFCIELFQTSCILRCLACSALLLLHSYCKKVDGKACRAASPSSLFQVPQKGIAHLGAKTERKNIRLIWNLFLTLTDIGMHHYYLYHIKPSAQVFKGQ